MLVTEGLEPAVFTRCWDASRDQIGNSLLQVSNPRCLAGVRRGKVMRDVDIDEKNLTYARSNIIQNNLKSRIRPFQTKPNDALIPLDAIGLERHVPKVVVIFVDLHPYKHRLLYVQPALLLLDSGPPLIGSRQIQATSFSMHRRRYRDGHARRRDRICESYD